MGKLDVSLHAYGVHDVLQFRTAQRGELEGCFRHGGLRAQCPVLVEQRGLELVEPFRLPGGFPVLRRLMCLRGQFVEILEAFLLLELLEPLADSVLELLYLAGVLRPQEY